MTKEALLIFTKNPEAGKVKTRLAATIGSDTALTIYLKLLRHTSTVTNDLPVDKFVFYSDYVNPDDTWSSVTCCKITQQGNDLGERMKNAFDTIFCYNYERAVIIGTDCDELSGEIIMNAFVNLQSHDVVIGPAKDGGYYLLGLKKLHQQIFEDINWSTGRVFKETLDKCITAGLQYYLLPMLNDIDDEEDLLLSKLNEK